VENVKNHLDMSKYLENTLKMRKNPNKSCDLEMTLRSSSRSKVTKVIGEGPESLGWIIMKLLTF